MAPPPGSIGGVNNTPPVLGRNPTNYGNYMQQQMAGLTSLPGAGEFKL